LTQASVLTISSYANRTSPVLRGKWVLENILGMPPPPPPANVPALADKTAGLSLRQQLEKHRSEGTCASCHSRMDPLGFGLENFNAIGAWRTHDGGQKIDASGTLPDGRTFAGVNGLKEILVSDRDAFVHCLAEKMLTYALGRGLTPDDDNTVRTISGLVAADGYRFSRLVLEIVQSTPFQTQKRSREMP